MRRADRILIRAFGKAEDFQRLGARHRSAVRCRRRFRVPIGVGAIQPVKFLDLIWASLMGWLIFSEEPALTTYTGALVIFAATTWIARREARRRS